MNLDRYNLEPSVWGPSFWKTIHFVTLGYSSHPKNTEKEAMINFLLSLKTLIPCLTCRNHYKENLSKSNLQQHLKSRDSMILWGYNLHNNVNKMLLKTDYPFNDFKKAYSLSYENGIFTFENNPKHTSVNYILLAVFFGAIILVGFCFFKKSKNKKKRR